MEDVATPERDGSDGTPYVSSWKKAWRSYSEGPTGRSGKGQLALGCVVLALSFLYVLIDGRPGLAYYHYANVVVGLMGVALGGANLLYPGRIALVKLLRLAGASLLLVFLVLMVVGIAGSA
jgi:hypothetical protein